MPLMQQWRKKTHLIEIIQLLQAGKNINIKKPQKTLETDAVTLFWEQQNMPPLFTWFTLHTTQGHLQLSWHSQQNPLPVCCACYYEIM